ncbi:unnamed protein product, partial [marine sediment metagenome]
MTLTCILEAALDYHHRDWSLIPIQPRTKVPACPSWKPYQTERADEAKLHHWFGSNGDQGVAVICGEVSGGLVVRDFDQMAAYERWAAEYPELAETLPTVATGRPGRHVYVRANIDQIRDLSPSRGSVLTFDDGEVRGGGYCLLPPSKHPNGNDYRWIVPLGDESPEVDLISSGLLPCNREDRVNTGGQRRLKTLVVLEEETNGKHESTSTLQLCHQDSLETLSFQDSLLQPNIK